MSNIKIEKINDKRGLEKFIQFHYDLYRGNEYDVPNLHSDEINTLSADKNPAFDFCEAQYFLAYKDGKVAGRVAAIKQPLATTACALRMDRLHRRYRSVEGFAFCR